MKKKGPIAGIAGQRRSFRLEWTEDREGEGTVYLFGVETFGDYSEKQKSFYTRAGKVTVLGEELFVSTFRSGGIEISGSVRGVTFDPGTLDRGNGKCD